MRLGAAVTMLRMILGDSSESVWSDSEVLVALNSAHQRVWRRLVTKNPEQYATLVSSTEEHGPLSYGAGKDFTNLQGQFTLMTGTHSTAVPLQILKLSYATSESGLDSPVDIPLVPIVALEDRKHETNLEYELSVNFRGGMPKYRAAFTPTDCSLFIRPIPQVTLHLKMFYVDGTIEEFLDTDLSASVYSQPFLLVSGSSHDAESPGGGSSSPYIVSHSVNSGLSDAVVFDAAYLLGFKDESTRSAFAQERERILDTQTTPSTYQEAY